MSKHLIQASNHGSLLVVLEPAAAQQKRKPAAVKTGDNTRWRLICCESIIGVTTTNCFCSSQRRHPSGAEPKRLRQIEVMSTRTLPHLRHPLCLRTCWTQVSPICQIQNQNHVRSPSDWEWDQRLRAGRTWPLRPRPDPRSNQVTRQFI